MKNLMLISCVYFLLIGCWSSTDNNSSSFEEKVATKMKELTQAEYDIVHYNIRKIQLNNWNEVRNTLKKNANYQLCVFYKASEPIKDIQFEIEGTVEDTQGFKCLSSKILEETPIKFKVNSDYSTSTNVIILIAKK